ncbi:hypothetical protein XJ28_26905 [Pseudomonas syringae pv. tomato]|nr:hypothetical protein XJ28_26905 [Pseudomonas syringae pv. tomato]
MPCVTLLRHKSASRRTFKIGRGASRTACDAERRTIVEIIVPQRGNESQRVRTQAVPRRRTSC